MRKRIKKYKGLSLIEMLISIFIIATVMLLSAVTLTTLIRASTISAQRTTAREESEFILELLRRNVRNSDTEDIQIFTTSGRAYNEDNGLVEASGEILGYGQKNDEGVPGNEIHFRPTGFQRWVCVGFFPGKDNPSIGYILKSSSLEHEDPKDCFDSLLPDYVQNTVILNSEEIDINSLSVSYFNTIGQNILMTMDLEVEPIHWISGTGNIKPKYFKQSVVSTQKLTWE